MVDGGRYADSIKAILSYNTQIPQANRKTGGYGAMTRVELFHSLRGWCVMTTDFQRWFATKAAASNYLKALQKVAAGLL